MPFDLYSTSSLLPTQPTVLLTEGFETGTINSTTGPNGWTTSITPAPSSTIWTIKGNGTPTAPVIPPYAPVTIYSNTNDQYYISDNTTDLSLNSVTSLISPSVSTLGYTTLTLEFWNYYRDKGSAPPYNDNGYIDVSTDNFATYTNIAKFNEVHGYPNSFAHENFNLSAYVGLPNVKFRFRFEPTQDYYWAIDNIKLTGTSPITGFTWTSNPAGYTDTTNVSPTGLTQTGTTEYIATYTDISAGCSGSASVTVSSFPTPVTPTISAGGPTTFCSGSSVTLTSSPATTYQWNQNGSALSGQTAQTYTASLNTNYSVTISDANGCLATSALTYLTVNPVISNNSIGSTQTICFGQTPIILSGSTSTGGNGTYTYLWENSSDNITFTPATGVNNLVNYSPPSLIQTTWYRRVVTSGGCTSTSNSIQITVNPLPTITGTLVVCEGSTTQLTGSGTAAASSPWVSSNTAIATVSNTGLVTGISAGTVTITYTNNNNCSQTATVTVNAKPSTSAIYHQ
jgi:hypothetical protein